MDDIDLAIELTGIERGFIRKKILRDDPYRIEKLEAKRKFYQNKLNERLKVNDKGMELGIGRKYCRNANGAYVRAIDSIDKQLKEARGKDV